MQHWNIQGDVDFYNEVQVKITGCTDLYQATSQLMSTLLKCSGLFIAFFCYLTPVKNFFLVYSLSRLGALIISPEEV